jgi:hypothetical protein
MREAIMALTLAEQPTKTLQPFFNHAPECKTRSRAAHLIYNTGLG